MPMKKIAVLRCLRTSNNCTGSGCLKAFNNKTNAFAVYEAEETELAAFLNCSGCGDVQMPNNEEGLRKKLDRLYEADAYDHAVELLRKYHYTVYEK